VTEAQRLAVRINELRPSTKSGSLRFFGEWFGGRRDNWHVITVAAASGDDLIVEFDEGEKLTVSEPSGVQVDPKTFQIDEASRVCWEWFSYGEAKTEENLYVIEYLRTSDGVTVADSAKWDGTTHRPDASAPAVLID
jgi:hypothetical protein